MRTRGAIVASAAAALLLAGISGTGRAEEGGSQARIKCEGVNSCKGHSECKTAHNACKGKNGCGGKGFLMLTRAECDAARAKAAQKEE